MKKLKATLSLLLTSVLIAATAGFSVSRHYCLGTLVSESFYGLSDDCSSHSNDGSCAESQWFNTDCCEDEFFSITGIDVLATDKDHHTGIPQSIASLSPAIIQAELISSRASFLFAPRPPPRFTSGQEILVWEQRFLI